MRAKSRCSMKDINVCQYTRPADAIPSRQSSGTGGDCWPDGDRVGMDARWATAVRLSCSAHLPDSAEFEAHPENCATNSRRNGAPAVSTAGRSTAASLPDTTIRSPRKLASATFGVIFANLLVFFLMAWSAGHVLNFGGDPVL